MWKKKREEIRGISRDNKYVAIEVPPDNQLGPHFYSRSAHPFPYDCPVQLLKLQSAILAILNSGTWLEKWTSQDKRCKIFSICSLTGSHLMESLWGNFFSFVYSNSNIYNSHCRNILYGWSVAEIDQFVQWPDYRLMENGFVLGLPLGTADFFL